MTIKAFTLPGCKNCTLLKELFQRAEVEYSEYTVGKDIQVLEFNKIYPGIRQFPYVVIDDEPVGGLIDVIKLFVSKGLVSSNRG